MSDFNLELDNIQNLFIEKLMESLAIPSLMNVGEDGTLFGKEIQRCLEETIKLAEELGFKTFIDKEGYYGYAEIGKGEELVGVLGHLDVVPPGDLSKWNTNPFVPTIKDGKLYARGAQDDKGPTIAALFACKALMNTGHEFNRRVRFIFGTDEENLWRGIAKYVEREEIPTMAFTPDGAFPIVYAEKGLFQYFIKGENKLGLELTLGDAMNSVPSIAKYDGNKLTEVKAELDKLGFKYNDFNNYIEVVGESVHSKDAHKGTNAIIRLLIAMKNAGFVSEEISFLTDVIGEDAHGTNIFGVLEDEPTGRITINVGKIDFKRGESEIGIDIRFPVVATNKEEVTNMLSESVKSYSLVLEEYDYLRPVYMPLDCELVENLLDIYQEISGDTETRPIASGGATYSRAMENCVAFGPNFPNRPKTEHQPNEFIELEYMKKAMTMYGEAIKRLTK